MYPRGKAVADPNDNDVTAYAARVGMELGADIVKVHYTGSTEKFQWVVRSAGQTKVLSSGGERSTDTETLRVAKEVMSTGAAGMAIGRNIWESDDPDVVSQKLHQIIIEGKLDA
jgi:class I fructose-bisphosphate aldolase